MVVGRIASLLSVRNARVLALGLLVLPAALMMGGCNDDVKAQNEQLMAENQKLTQAEQDSKQSLAASQARITELESQLASRPSQPIGGGYDGGGGGGGGGGGRATPRSRASESDVVIEVAGDVLFDPGQTTIKAGAKKRLDEIASTIKRKYSGHSVRIDGYTDSDPIKKAKFSSNEALSKARAESVKKYLASKGVSSSTISTRGMGAASPRSSKAASRRVEIVILGN